LIKFLQGSLIIVQHHFHISTCSTSEYIVWLKKISMSSSYKAPWKFLNIILTFSHIFKVNVLFSSRTFALLQSCKLFNNPSTSFWQFYVFSKWMQCLVRGHWPYRGFVRLLDNYSTSFWHLHVFSKWTCIVWFKNINLVKVLQNSLIICWHSFDISTCS
jgi:hypothetical protein